jgi:hypothetical protein
MFYLKIFFETILDNKLKGLSFLGLLFSLVYCLNSTSTIQQKVQDYFKREESAIVKVLVTKTVDIQQVVQFYQQLPGIKKVELGDMNNLVSKVNQDLKDNKIDLPEHVFFSDYNFLTLKIDNQLSEVQQQELKAKISSILPSHKIIVSGIKKPFLSYKENPSVIWLMKYSAYILLFVLFCFYLLTSHFCYELIYGRSFLFQSFQRKKGLAPKVFISGLLLCNILALVIPLVQGDLSIGFMTIWMVFNLGLGFFYYYRYHQTSLYRFD